MKARLLWSYGGGGGVISRIVGDCRRDERVCYFQDNAVRSSRDLGMSRIVELVSEVIVVDVVRLISVVGVISVV